MAPARLLIVAGTTEATALARRLDEGGVDVTSSLAGVTSDPVARPGRVRRGGFGGPVGLAGYLRDEGFAAVVDATHPFAAVMPFNVAAACAATGVPGCRLLRPEWVAQEGDRWVHVPALEEVPAALDRLGARRVLLATGRQQLDAFERCTGQQFVVRSIEPPDVQLPGMTSILGRGPFDVEEERRLLVDHGIDVVVAKNAGGSATEAKLVAARHLGITVIVVARPPQPPGVPVVSDVDGALAWLPVAAGVRPELTRRTGG